MSKDTWNGDLYSAASASSPLGAADKLCLTELTHQLARLSVKAVTLHAILPETVNPEGAAVPATSVPDQ